jgi:hypothetical protein
MSDRFFYPAIYSIMVFVAVGDIAVLILDGVRIFG